MAGQRRRTIVNDDATVVDVTATADGAEPATDGAFTVSLTNPADTDTVVTYTVGGTATADGDDMPLTRTFTIPAGETTATIPVAVLDDTLVEGDETVSVTLTSTTNGTLGTVDATVTIADDDAATLSIDDVSLVEGDAGTTDFVFTVSMSNPSTTDVTVDYTTTDGTATVADGDYVAGSGTVTILAGETTATVTVPVNGDTTVESDETFFVDLSNAVGATLLDAQGEGTIVDYRDEKAWEYNAFNHAVVASVLNGEATGTPGALHLDGYDDRTPKQREEMRRAERRVLGKLGLGDVFGSEPESRSKPKPRAPRTSARARKQAKRAQARRRKKP